MGFGLDRTIHGDRLWSFPIRFCILDGFTTTTRNNLWYAIVKWQNPLNRGPLFNPVATAEAGCVRVQVTTGSNQWSSGDKGMVGKAPTLNLDNNFNNVLFLKDGAAEDTLVHELGHLLGLAHEHDRDDPVATKYRSTLTIKFADTVAENAVKVKKYVKYGEFDAGSIMCYGTANTTGPSDSDRATLKAIYGW